MARKIQNLVAELDQQIKDLREAREAKNRVPDEPITIDRMFKPIGIEADQWQRDFFNSKARQHALLCCRRAGKSTAAAARVMAHCANRPSAMALIFSPTSRQSNEFLRYVKGFDRALGHPNRIVRESLSEVEWSNGSRVLSLPDNQAGVVGLTPTMMVVDEASRVSDILYRSIRPMMVTGIPEMVILSTPFGKRGWFFDIFSNPDRLKRWVTFRVSADMVSRFDKDFLADERVELGPRWYRQEYELSFEDAVDSVFLADDILEAFKTNHRELIL